MLGYQAVTNSGHPVNLWYAPLPWLWLPEVITVTKLQVILCVGDGPNCSYTDTSNFYYPTLTFSRLIISTDSTVSIKVNLNYYLNSLQLIRPSPFLSTIFIISSISCNVTFRQLKLKLETFVFNLNFYLILSIGN